MIVQFLRFRRGVPEVVSTRTYSGTDEHSALDSVMALRGSRLWPAQTEAIRILGESGRTLMQSMLTTPSTVLRGTSPDLVQKGPASTDLAIARPSASVTLVTRTARQGFEIGQAVSYAKGGLPEFWAGGFEIVGLHAADKGGTQYAIRNAEESCDRIVQQHELCEDLGARGRGR
jgi:hypothetical protein